MTDANTVLMTRIQAEWGAMITEVSKTSTVPPAFLAALVANETGGNPHETRFERGALAALWEVLLGRKEAYGSIRRDDLFDHISAAVGAQPPISSAGLLGPITGALRFVDGLATSWGLTQIMGYEAIVFGISFTDLQNPLIGLRTSLKMVSQFASRDDLDVRRDFSQMFDCWNTGRPHAPTADPQYIPNGLARMKIYEEVASGE
jgi:hypothetical protein